jgi:hypothetical protein
MTTKRRKTKTGTQVKAQTHAHTRKGVKGGGLDLPTKMYCAPGTDSSHGSCYSQTTLKRFAKALKNEYGTAIDINQDPSSIVQQLKNSPLSKECNSEICWARSKVAREQGLTSEMMNHLRPMMPKEWLKERYTWLNNHDIEKVMRQYHNSVPDFHFLGIHSGDFNVIYPGSSSCISPDMCALNVVDMWQKGIRQMGAIFNLDLHSGPGTHWVSLYINMDPSNVKQYSICYYDSNGVKPPETIERFMHDVQRHLYELHRKLAPLQYMKINHQYENSECGMFSIYCLIRLLSGYTFEDVVQSKKYDDYVNELRTVLFVPYEKVEEMMGKLNKK